MHVLIRCIHAHNVGRKEDTRVDVWCVTYLPTTLHLKLTKILYMSFTSLVFKSQQQSIWDHPHLSTNTPPQLHLREGQTFHKHRRNLLWDGRKESKHLLDFNQWSQQLCSPCAASCSGGHSSGLMKGFQRLSCTGRNRNVIVTSLSFSLSPVKCWRYLYYVLFFINSPESAFSSRVCCCFRLNVPGDPQDGFYCEAGNAMYQTQCGCDS